MKQAGTRLEAAFPAAAAEENGAASLTKPGQWTLHFENTAAKQEFTIASAKDQLSLRSSA